MIRQELPPQAAIVKLAVASTTTCSSATLEQLIVLLGESRPPVRLKPKKSVSKDPLTSRTALDSAKTLQPRSKRKQTVSTVVEIHEDISRSLEPPEKLRLATEIVNSALKGLTEAIRTPTVQKPRSSGKAQKQSCLADGVPASTPLQPQSINRIPQISEKPSCPRPSSSLLSNGRSTGVVALAECARLAFATLRKLNSQKVPGTQMPRYQLEAGMLALISKMVTLGLDDLAIKELRILMKRLSGGEESSEVTIPFKNHIYGSSNPAKQSLADLLYFAQIPRDQECLSLVVASQLQVLKLMASRRGDPTYIEAAFEHLQDSAPHAPKNLILELTTESSIGSREKAARQLDMLSQSLISLCPSTSSADDDAAADSRRTISPHVALDFQMLSLKTRTAWWNLSGHRANIHIELVEPFAKYMRVFCRRSRLPDQGRYEKAKAAYACFSKLTSVNDATPCPSSVSHGSRTSGYSEIYQDLAELALRTSRHDEAVQWFRRSVTLAAECGASQSRICNIQCQISTILLQSGSDDSHSGDCSTALQDVIIALEKDLQGDSADLDDLLLSITRLRKVIYIAIAGYSTTKEVTNSLMSSPFAINCTRVLSLVPTFLMRYIGLEPDPKPGSKPFARYNKRRMLADKAIKPTVETIANLSKLSVSTDSNIWRNIDEALQNCKRLVAFTETPSKRQNSLRHDEITEHPLLLTLSNAYWCYYLKEKQNSENSADLRVVLQKSIDLIVKAKLTEKTSSFLPVKLEHLAILFDLSGDIYESLYAFAEAARILIGSGCLDVATESAATEPLSSAFDKDSSSGNLGRILSAYCRVALKVGGNEKPVSLFYDDQKLSSIKRGVMLEYQLTVLEKVLHARASPTKHYLTLNELASRLLDIYTEAEYPIRRLRTVANLLRIHFTHSSSLQDDISIRLLREQGKAFPVSFDADAGLSSLAANLIASCDAYSILLQGTCTKSTLEPALKTWHDLVQASPDSKSLQAKVGDLTDWLNLLLSVMEYLGMQGLEMQRAEVLSIIVAAKELSSAHFKEGLVFDLSVLGQQLVRLGFSMSAGLNLQKAKRYMEAFNVSTTDTLIWHLASAEYFLEIGNTNKCEEHVTSAGSIIVLRSSGEKSRTKTSSEQICSISTTSSIAYIRSHLAVAQGQLAQAIFYGRICVKLSHRQWALLEHRTRRMASSQVTKTSKDELELISNDMSSLSISATRPLPILSTEHRSLKSTPFWSLVPRLFHGLLHLAQLFAHEGLLPEARYYTQQAQTVAVSVKSTPFQARCHALEGEYEIYGGRLKDGLEKLHLAETTMAEHQRTPFIVSLQGAIAQAYGSESRWDRGESSFRLAEDSLREMKSSTFFHLPARKKTSVVDLSSQLGNLVLKETVVKQKLTARKGSTLTVRIKKENLESTQPETLSCSVPSTDDSLLQKIQARLLRQQARSAILQKKTRQANSLLAEAAALPGTQQDLLMQTLGQAQLCLCQGLEMTFSDPVFCVLHESTLSYPSIIFDRRHQSQDRKEPVKEVKSRAAKPRKQPSRPLAKDITPKPIERVSDFNDYFHRALETVRKFHSIGQSTAPSSMLHTIADMSSKVFMMLSANGSTRPKSSINSIFTVYMTELGRSISVLKEISAILVEKQICAQPESSLMTAIESLEDLGGLLKDSTVDLASFEADYIDILPPSWTVISISLSEDHDELRFSRLGSRQSPFILTIPLSRHSSRDAEEVVFGFDQGKSELLDIIELANYSCHDAQDMSVKGAKTAWWEARSALDARLKDLLVNIENIWLGGFRGIFAQNSPRKDLLSRFQQSFYNILERHLPSRQKCSKAARTSRPTLDSRVLELFVSLGNPNEAGDMDEALMDLLYFVIDILQFYGERNAYDEIDFDSIAIETLDALRQYHEAALRVSQDRSPSHAILILDKALHCFPWESLPCMNGRAVSRLPSLVCLRKRILQVQRQNTAHPYASEGFLINHRNTSYILNPSSDLASTQSTFLPSLSTLPVDPLLTASIVGRSPSESEFQSLLSTNSLFLYFGHGSGGQYIRFRTVKKLDQCAVSLLMGCSSAKLKEEGGYEPHGMIKNYLAAGAPAVVGMLWDVTDKDCDRWGMECLESWGLFENESAIRDAGIAKETKKKGGKGKGKKQDELVMREEPKQERQKARGIVSLDQAVAMGREKCFLRYLNGAAPVMYGIPTFLS